MDQTGAVSSVDVSLMTDLCMCVSGEAGLASCTFKLCSGVLL